MIEYDGRIADYHRFQTKEMCQTVKGFDNKQKKRVLETIQLKRLQCVVLRRPFDEKLLKAVEKTLLQGVTK